MKFITGTFLFACLVVATHGIGLKIKGGFVRVYDKAYNFYQWGLWGAYIGTQHAWGSASNIGAAELLIGESECWYGAGSRGAYCRHFVLISTKNNPTEWYWQIVGSYQKVYDKNSANYDRTRHQYGDQTAPWGSGKIARSVFSGKSWSPGHNAWGHAYLWWVLKQTNGQSTTNSFSSQRHKGGAEYSKRSEVYIPLMTIRSYVPYGDRKRISQFQCYDNEWSPANCYQYLWQDKP